MVTLLFWNVNHVVFRVERCRELTTFSRRTAQMGRPNFKKTTASFWKRILNFNYPKILGGHLLNKLAAMPRFSRLARIRSPYTYGLPAGVVVAVP